MKQTHLEPGLLPVFRLYVGLRLIEVFFQAIDFGLQGKLGEISPSIYIVISLTEIGILSLYLFWSPLCRKLTHGHLPLVLGISATLPIVAMSSFLYNDPKSHLMAHIIEEGSVELLANLLIVLVLISWQYHFRAVLLFCLGTSTLQLMLFGLPLSQNSAMMRSMLATLLIRTIVFLIVGYLIVRLMNTQREQRRALRQANDRLVAYAATLEQLAISRERNRMARELHDTLAHTLSGLAVQLDSVTTLWDSIPPEANAMLEKSLATIRSGLDETRRALQALRATPLDDLGLSLAIRTLAEETAARGNLLLEIELPEEANTLPPEVEHCFYRVTQEALENVLKHARAQKVSVHLRQVNGRLALTIEDNGEGFRPDTEAQDHHFGIKGMFERAEMVGAAFEITSQPGQGSTVYLSWEKSG